MGRKAALITEAIAHLMVDLACFFLLAGHLTATAKTTVLIGAGYLIFLILSYGLRPYFGLFLDEYPRAHSQAIGCLLVGVACLLPQRWAWIALFPAAVGSALFHTGALGESVAFARGYFSRNAIVLSTGVFGAALGTILAQRTTPAPWMIAVVLFFSAFLCFFFAEARKYPRRIRSFRHSITRSLPDWAILVLTAFPALAATLAASLLPADWAKGLWTLIPAAVCMVGRLAGGVAADRFGPRKTLVGCFGIALVLLTVFTHIPWLYCIGLGALCAPLPITFGTSTAALSTKPHFAVGICSMTVLLGTIPAFFQRAATNTVRGVSALLILAALVVSVFLYTDHRRIFNLGRKASIHLGKGGAK